MAKAKEKAEPKNHRRLVDAQVKERFADWIARTPEYVVQQIHRDGDIVKLWRCGKPQSSTCMCYVCSAPNCLMVYGDMGECMWQRHYDMIPFIRGSVHSTSYFAEKVPREINIQDEYPELVEEWFAEVKQERIDGGYDWTEEHDEELQNIRDEWENYGIVADFHKAHYESKLFRDCEDHVTTKYYSFHYLWKTELLAWFIQQLDAGKVLPYVEPEENGTQAV